MKNMHCDVAIIGAGTAGLAARRAAVAAGARTLLIERGPGGTTCARSGCMPSKLLIAAAHAAHAVREAARFGVACGGPAIDGRAVMARVRRRRDEFVGGVLDDVARLDPDQKLAGVARFIDRNTLLVGDDVKVAASAIVIATGSQPAIPDHLKALGDRVITSDDVFDLTDLPSRLAVIGAGPLGVELGQAFARLGVAVHVFDQGQALGGLKDPGIMAEARHLLGGDMAIALGVSVQAAIDGDGDGVRLTWRDSDDAPRALHVDRVLVATGRPPDIAGLDLHRTGLPLDDHGLPRVDPETRLCGRGPIFMAGDVDGDRPVLHEAASEGAIAGRNAALYPSVRPGERHVPLSIVFTDPGIARVGRPEPGEGGVTGCYDFAGNGRAVIAGRAGGLLKIHAARDGRVCGAEMLAPDAEHLAHLLAWAIEARMDIAAMLAMPFYHPTYQEGVRGALQDARSKLG